MLVADTSDNPQHKNEIKYCAFEKQTRVGVNKEQLKEDQGLGPGGLHVEELYKIRSSRSIHKKLLSLK